MRSLSLHSECQLRPSSALTLTFLQCLLCTSTGRSPSLTEPSLYCSEMSSHCSWMSSGLRTPQGRLLSGFGFCVLNDPLWNAAHGFSLDSPDFWALSHADQGHLLLLWRRDRCSQGDRLVDQQVFTCAGAQAGCFRLQLDCDLIVVVHFYGQAGEQCSCVVFGVSLWFSNTTLRWGWCWCENKSARRTGWLIAYM